MDDVKALTNSERKDAALILRRLSQPCPSAHDFDTCPRCLTIESLAHHSGRIFDLMARAADALAAPQPSGEREAPADLVALVTEWQEAERDYDTPPYAPLTVKIERIRAATRALRDWRPSPPGERPACPWTEDEDGIWHTGCGRSWDFEAGGVVENRQTYCMGCGHPVAAAPFIEGRRS